MYDDFLTFYASAAGYAAAKKPVLCCQNRVLARDHADVKIFIMKG